jgi:uncharacterized protein with HEPN domain
MPGDEAWLADMLTAARHALNHTAGMNREAFLADLRTQHAVEMQIVIIGEAGGKVSDETRSVLPSVPFRDIVRMRNRLVHHYFKADLNLIWNVVRDDLPGLIAALEAHLEMDSSGNAGDAKPEG